MSFRLFADKCITVVGQIFLVSSNSFAPKEPAFSSHMKLTCDVGWAGAPSVLVWILEFQGHSDCRKARPN